MQLDEIDVVPPAPDHPVGAAPVGVMPQPRGSEGDVVRDANGDVVDDLRSPKIGQVLDEVETAVRAAIVHGDPVLLFEPRRGIYLPPGRPGEPAREVQTEGIIKAGFTRFLADLNEAPRRLPLWSLSRTGDGVELRDGAQGSWARGPANLDVTWLETAAARGEVLVLYGVQLGVRDPGDGRPYGEEERMAELATSRTAGAVAAAHIPWPVTPAPRSAPDATAGAPRRERLGHRLARALRRS